jgi:selenide,water dikinase
LLYDPQTSGGLLISVAAGDAPELLAALQGAGIPAAEIGRVAGPFTANSGGAAIVLR